MLMQINSNLFHWNQKWDQQIGLIVDMSTSVFIDIKSSHLKFHISVFYFNIWFRFMTKYTWQGILKNKY